MGVCEPGAARISSPDGDDRKILNATIYFIIPQSKFLMWCKVTYILIFSMPCDGWNARTGIPTITKIFCVTVVYLVNWNHAATSKPSMNFKVSIRQVPDQAFSVFHMNIY